MFIFLAAKIMTVAPKSRVYEPDGTLPFVMIEPDSVSLAIGSVGSLFRKKSCPFVMPILERTIHDADVDWDGPADHDS